jgi:hypothetical protein
MFGGRELSFSTLSCGMPDQENPVPTRVGATELILAFIAISFSRCASVCAGSSAGLRWRTWSLNDALVDGILRWPRALPSPLPPPKSSATSVVNVASCVVFGGGSISVTVLRLSYSEPCSDPSSESALCGNTTRAISSICRDKWRGNSSRPPTNCS